MAEQILSIIEALLQGAGANMKLMIAAGQEEDSQLEMLLEIIKTPYVVSHGRVNIIGQIILLSYYIS